MTTTADGRLIDLTRDEPGRHYRATVDGRVVGETEFLLTPDLVVFTHTRIDRAFESQGIGPVLGGWPLDDPRDRGSHVLPRCPVAQAYLALHEAECPDLVVQRAGRES